MKTSRNLKKFFSNTTVSSVICFSILVYVALTIISVVEATNAYASFLFFLNCAFIIEIALRFFTYKDFSDYLKNHALDMVAVFPWDAALYFAMGRDANVGIIVVLRLFRLLRLRSFLFIWRSSLKQRLSYVIKKQVEQSLLRQFLILIGAIVALTISFGLLFRFIGYSSGETSLFYMAFLALLDPGTSMEVSGRPLVIQVVFNLLVIIGIVLFNGLTIGVIVAKVESYLERVKEGYGDVVEKGHTLILGWSSLARHVIEEINEFAVHESHEKQQIVLVSENVDDVAAFVRDKRLKYIDLVKRKGAYHTKNVLDFVGLQSAKKVLIFNEKETYSLPFRYRKSKVFKSCLAANVALSGSDDIPDCFYETASPTNRKILEERLGPNFHGFDRPKYSALLLNSLLFHKEYYHILLELFGFENDEFHFVEVESCSLEGKSFQELVKIFTHSIPIGIVQDGMTVLILPPEKYILQSSDKIICLGESRDAIVDDALSSDHSGGMEALAINENCVRHPLSGASRKVMIIGVNESIPSILNELHLWNTEVEIFTNEQGQSIAEEYFELMPVSHQNYSFVFDGVSGRDLTEVFGIFILVDEWYRLEYPESSVDTDTLYKLFDVQGKPHDCPVIVEVQDPEEESMFQHIEGVQYVVGTNILAKILNMSLVYPEALPFFSELISLRGKSLNFSRVTEITIEKNVLFSRLYSQFYEIKGCIALAVLRAGTKPLVNPLRVEQVDQDDYKNFEIRDGSVILHPDDEIVFVECFDEYVKGQS